jgi:hypothetical protein
MPNLNGKGCMPNLNGSDAYIPWERRIPDKRTEGCMPEDASGGKAVLDSQQKVCMPEYTSRGKSGSARISMHAQGRIQSGTTSDGRYACWSTHPERSAD